MSSLKGASNNLPIGPETLPGYDPVYWGHGRYSRSGWVLVSRLFNDLSAPPELSPVRTVSPVKVGREQGRKNFAPGAY